MNRSFHRAATAAGLSAATALAALLLPVAASAHVTLEHAQAPAGSFHKIVLRVPHGCAGSPTVAVKVQIPPGVTAVKPQPKPGWALTIVHTPLDAPVADSHGNPVTDAVAEIHWTGGHLLDAHYDEFAMRVRLPDAPGETVYFPVVQECEEGVERWIDTPATGGGDDTPAPGLTLTPRG